MAEIHVGDFEETEILKIRNLITKYSGIYPRVALLKRIKDERSFVLYDVPDDKALFFVQELWDDFCGKAIVVFTNDTKSEVSTESQPIDDDFIYGGL